jgi:hypothetical protein
MSVISSMLTTDPLYDEPVKYKVSILSPDELDTIHTYDSFNTSNAPFVLTGMGVNLSVGENTQFRFQVDDSKDRVIKDTIDCGYIAVIQAGKSQAEYKNIAYGIIDEINDDYPAGEQIKYEFAGLGFGVIFNHTILNFVKSANKESITGPQSILNDPNFRLDNLVLEAFNNRDFLPVRNSKTLKERGGFNTDGIEGFTKVVTPSVVKPYSTASSIFEDFAATSGTALWVGPNKEVLFRAPHSRHSGVTIRPWDPTRTNDRADTTSYYYGGWSSQKQMKVDSGFFNRVFVSVNTDEIVSTSSGETTNNFTTLALKDVGTQFIPGSTKLFNIALLLSKAGNGRSPVDDSYNLTGVQGCVCKDDGANQPSNNIIATFNIPYDRIDETPTSVYDINLQYFVSNIEPSTRHWIVLFKRGETEENTIRWHHDSDFITDSTSVAPRYSGTKRPFTPQPSPFNIDFATGFATNSRGPVFKYSFFSTKTTTIEVSDPVSIRKYTPGRPVEVRINAPWIRDIKTGFKYANTLLQYGAKLKRIFDKKAVSIPTGMFFPLQVVNIEYPIAGIDHNSNMLAEINSVNYAGSGYEPTNPFGSYTVNLTATAYVNHYQRSIEGMLSCI